MTMTRNISPAAGSQGSSSVRPDHRFDEAVLAHWMAAHVADYRGPMHVEQFRGGQSNPTYKLITADRTYVLRRKPVGTTLRGAHAVDREARVLRALAGADYPVAQVFALCTDDAVIGSWFYIMEYVEGRIFWDATFPEVSPDDRPSYFDAMNATIARLHLLRVSELDLEDYGHTGNYFARQISRLTRQYLADEIAGRNADMDALIDWLPSAIPDADDTALVHGDFRCDNLIFHRNEPRIVAVLDWELSTLGHPLADFAYHWLMYRMPPDIVAGLADADLGALNIPAPDAYLERYCRRVGLTSVADWEFYVAFNFFRLAAIFHGIKGRVIRGTAASASAAQRAAHFPRLASLARTAMDRIR